MHFWFNLSQEYALPINYIIKPPGGFLCNARVDYNIVTTPVITVSHIFSVKDLSNRLSFPKVTLSFNDIHRNIYTVMF